MGKMEYIDDIVKWEQEFHFFYPVTVRFSETDLFGHLNNTVPFVYFEQARVEFLKSKGLMQKWLQPESETIPVAADLQCDFVKQIYFDEEIKIYVKANSVGTSSADIHYMGKKTDGTICLTGRGTIVQIAKQTGRGFPWSREMKALLLEKREIVNK
ncbi:acyl-CoA thioesterase [Mesobacillus maritimus]|uniref:acyl-CoA thioesterase n=1 Tax=Mesobacillus maritimus TaxID=1643336 RepID=UPI00203BAEE1|nr:acyl-CoA thioesterase [Mesobacillus maritimus]